MSWHWESVSKPPPRTIRFYIVAPDGTRSRPYKTAAAAKGQLKKHPIGSQIKQH